MISRRDLRFDGKLFFLYDREAVTSEEDPPENAIIYFYPTSSTIESRISICGQLVGMSNFLTTVMDFAPVLINLKTEKVALCQSGQYTLALGGTMSEPETLLLKQLETLFNIFVFYHGSLDTVRKLSKDHATFLTNMSIIWDCYLHFIRHYGDTLPAVFNPLPFLKTPKNSSGCFLKASHILQACQRRHHILGGCILHQKSVLCTQLETSITKRLLLLKPNQSHHPGKQVKIDIKLPFGVRFMESFVTYSEYNQLIKALQKSPYHASIKGVKLRPCKSPKPQHSKEETTVSTSAKEGSPLQVQSAERSNVLTRENSHTQPTQKPTTEKAVKENMDLETSTNRVTKEHSGDPKLDVEDLTSVEPDKGNSQSSSSVSKTAKQKKEIKKPSTIKENGKTRKKSGKPSLKKKSNENEIFDGKIIDEIKKDEVRINDLNTENIDDCDRGNLKQTKKEADDDNAKEPQCGSELIMDEIDISGLRIVNDNMKGPIRDIIEQGINGQSFIDSSRETDRHDHIDSSCNDSSKVSNDNGVIDNDTLDPSGATICHGAKGHSSTDPSRAKTGTSVSSSNFDGFSKDLSVKDKLSNGSQSADVHPGGDVENLHIDQAVNECPSNSNDFLDREMNVSSSQDSRSKESILDKLKCYSSNFTPQEDVIEEKLQSSMDGDVEGDDNDFHCDSAVRDPRPEFSHPDLPSPPIDLPGLHNHSDQASGIHNSQQEMLCSPTEEFHDTVEELDGGIKLTPNTVGAFLHTYQDLKSNDLMAGKYSTLNLNHPEDKKVDKSFFKDLINADKLASYTTHGFNDHVSDNKASRSTSSLLHREPSRSESTGRESGLSNTSSSSQGEETNRSESTGPESHLSHRTSSLYGSESDRNESTEGESGLSRSATPDSSAPSKLHDSGLCLLHGSSEGSLSQTDGTSNVESPDMKQSPVDFLSEKSSNSTTDLEMSCSTVCGDGEEVQKEQAEYVDDFDENLYQIDGLVHVNLYVQAHSNTVLILLADSSLSQDPETIKALWKTTLNEIGELEVQLNQFYKANSDYFDKLEDFNFVVYDSISSTTKGNLSEPVEQVDFKFCDTAKTVHEQFNNCTSLKSVTLRDHSSAVHCQRSLDQEVYFHKKGSLKPFRGSPSPRDSAFTLERRAPKRLKKDYGVNII